MTGSGASIPRIARRPRRNSAMPSRPRSREYTVQYRIIRPSDGETRWISVKSTIERDENGRASPAGRRAYRCHRTGAGGAGASAKRGALPQAGRPARRAERDAGATRRGKDPGARPDLERVAGSPGGRRPQRRLANGQSGMDQDARLERGRTAQPYLGMAGASRRQRHYAGAGQEARRRRDHRAVRKPISSQGRFLSLAVMDRASRTGIASMRSPAT